MTDNDNHKENIESGQTGADVSNRGSNGLPTKIKAGLLGLTPATIFKLTLLCSVIALAATIIYHTATDDIHVNVDLIHTAKVEVSGSQDIGGIELGGYAAVEYSLTNKSTAPAYVFIRIEEAIAGLYEVTGEDGGSIDGWTRVAAAEEPGQLIFAYTGESGNGGGMMMPVEISETVELEGRLHCLADAEMYSQLGGEDMDFDVYGCLVFGEDSSSGGSISSYNTSAAALYQAYMDNGGR